MLELAGPLAVAALVLVAGGASKLRDPAPTRGMFTALGVRSPGWPGLLAVVSGTIELGLGVAVFLVGGRVLASLTAVAFVLFTVFAVRLVRLPTTASCGCFGRHSGEATWLHVTVDAVVASVVVAAAFFDAPGFLPARAELPGAGFAFAGLAAIGAWLVVATITALPDALVAARRGPRPGIVRTFELTRTQ